MKTFDLPPEDDSYDGAPLTIEHGVDYMLATPKTLEFMYNYINYSWKIGVETVTARAYLDDINEVSLFAEADGVSTLMTPDKLEAVEFQPALRYLQRRYRVIKTFGGDGTYRVAYKR